MNAQPRTGLLADLAALFRPHQHNAEAQAFADWQAAHEASLALARRMPPGHPLADALLSGQVELLDWLSEQPGEVS